MISNKNWKRWAGNKKNKEKVRTGKRLYNTIQDGKYSAKIIKYYESLTSKPKSRQ